jgi:S-formylglutathione hydrolase FrmB
MPFRSFEVSDPALAPGGLRFLTVKSVALGQRADLTLFVPAQASGARQLPLCVLLHGVYGSHWAWAFRGAAHVTAARLIDAGRIPPLVLAMPSDGLWGDGSGYATHRHGLGAGRNSPDVERWIMDEVPAAARQSCDALSGDSPLLLAGLSMGGFGALRLAGRHRCRVTAASGLSSATDAAQLSPLIDEGCEAWAEEDGRLLSALTRDLPGCEDRGGDVQESARPVFAPSLEPASRAPLPPLHFACGLDDPFLAANRQLHAELSALDIRHEYAEHPGGHDWAYWSTHLEDSLLFFARALGHPGAA